MYAKSQQFNENTSFNIPYCSHYKFVDFTNDGNLDIILFGDPNFDDVICYNNVDGYTYAPINDLDYYYMCSDFTDIDKDGYIEGFFRHEITMGSYNNIELQNTLGSLLTSIWSGADGYDISHFDLNDYNNDGEIDMLLSTSSQVEVVDNNDNYIAGCSQITPIQNINNFFEFTTDFNHDGLFDLITDNGLFERSGYTFVNVWSNNGVSSSSWGDYNNDGKIDLVCVSRDSLYVIENDSLNNFGYINIGEEGKKYIIAQWGDYDNDGDLDILVENKYIMNKSSVKIIENKGSNIFEVSDSLLLLDHSSPQFVDYDDDGDLDIVSLSEIDLTGNLRFYENTINVINNPPQAPTGLVEQFINNEIILSWDAASDDYTNSSSLTYNIKIGTTPGGIDICSPNSLANGKRLIEEKGNQLLDTFAVYSLEPGIYYWSVQAIDNCYKGSTFSEVRYLAVVLDEIEQENICFEYSIFPNPATENITFELNTTQEYRNMQLHLTDMNGKVIEILKVNSNKTVINTEKWSKGIYFYSFYIDNKLFKSDKIIIE
jgi:hypothetical protein